MSRSSIGKFLAISALTILCTVPGARSFAADGLKVAVVDIKKCMVESKKGGKMAEAYKAKVDEIDKKLQKLEGEAQKISQDVERQQLLMSDSMKEEKKKRFMEIREEATSLQAEKRNMSDEVSQSILMDLQKVIDKFGAEKGFDLVITSGGPWLAYFSKTLDVTDELISVYDKTEPVK